MCSGHTNQYKELNIPDLLQNREMVLKWIDKLMTF